MPIFNSNHSTNLYSDPITISFTQGEIEALLQVLYRSDSFMSDNRRNDLIRKAQYAINNYERNYPIMLEAQRIVRNFPQYRERELRDNAIYSPYFGIMDSDYREAFSRNRKIRIGCSEDLLYCEEALRFIYNNINPEEIELFPIRNRLEENDFLSNLNPEINEEAFRNLYMNSCFCSDNIGTIKLDIDLEDKPKLGFFKD